MKAERIPRDDYRVQIEVTSREARILHALASSLVPPDALRLVQNSLYGTVEDITKPEMNTFLSNLYKVMKQVLNLDK